jgi:hypothetical protein
MPTFAPTEEQRAIVKLLAGGGVTHDRMRQVIKNQRTGLPISRDTLERAFANELIEGSVELDTISMTGLVQQMKQGNMTAIIWYQKNRMGWSDVSKTEVSGPDGKPLVTGIEVVFVVPKERLNGGSTKMIAHVDNEGKT